LLKGGDFMDYSTSVASTGGPFLSLIIALVYIIILGLSIYCFVLFVKFAHKGIKAFDIYINKNQY
jgi:predicted neutral ceramidase superfamily lipid hydrolase